MSRRRRSRDGGRWVSRPAAMRLSRGMGVDFSCAGAGWHGTPISLPTGQSGRRRSGRMCYSVLPLARTESSASEICLSDTTCRPYALMVGVILFKKICTTAPCYSFELQLGMVGGLTRIQDGMRSWSGQRERAREREYFIQGQFGTVRERQRVWHVIFI